MIAHRRWLGISTREWLKESDTPQGGDIYMATSGDFELAIDTADAFQVLALHQN